MSESPSVSVIIPVCNGEQTLAACLGALQSQTYSGPCSIIVVNDGSTDRTSAIARGFGQVLVLDQKNLGRACARNNGAARSSGEVLAFTDADCVPGPAWLEGLTSRLNENDRRGIVGGSIIIPDHANVWQKIDHQAWAHSIGPFAPAGATLFGSTANMCCRRSVFESVGGFDERLSGSEDSDLAFRIHKAGYENFFEPSAVVSHYHPRASLRAFLRQRYNYGKWTIQTVLKHKPLPPFSRLFPNNRFLLTLFWPLYSFLATGFTVLRNLPHDRSVLWLWPLHGIGRLAEYAGTIDGCGMYQRIFLKDAASNPAQERAQ